MIWMLMRRLSSSMRLGYQSFPILKMLYPNLFKSYNSDLLICDAYKFARHTRQFYPSTDNISLIPFITIHSDAWGSTQPTFLSGYR